MPVLPHKFEAGTPNIAGVIAFGAASRLHEFSIGMENIAAYEEDPYWIMRTERT